ncbi:MAG: SIR2 family protein, partial [Acetatifactor sp.]|nr:SIR2 family protein [Acetatifactor sp.]
MSKKEGSSDKRYWAGNEVFDTLCEVVMQNRLICLTGAGISKNLKLEDGTDAPDWRGLLSKLSGDLKEKLDNEQKKDIDELLSDKAKGEELIEAATILKKADKDLFNKYFVKSVKLENGVCSDTHKQLLKLCPNGIITYNYDEAHENAMEAMGQKNDWTVLTPYDEDKIKEIILNRFEHKFLLKAHGTVDEQDNMVLTRDSYRDLFVKYPAYKAFLQNLLTNYQLLIVGFGFSDPDFELLIKNIFSAYGSPIQKHIVIKHEHHKSSMDTFYKLRYGMNYLYVKDYNDIPIILEDCISSGGKYMDNVIDICLSKEIEKRSKVHKDIR